MMVPRRTVTRRPCEIDAVFNPTTRELYLGVGGGETINPEPVSWYGPMTLPEIVPNFVSRPRAEAAAQTLRTKLDEIREYRTDAPIPEHMVGSVIARHGQRGGGGRHGSTTVHTAHSCRSAAPRPTGQCSIRAAGQLAA